MTPEWVNELNQFTGTEHYYKVFCPLIHGAPVVMTDGAKFLADKAHCYWLMEKIGEMIAKKPNETFQVPILYVKDESWELDIEDGNYNILMRETGEYTDFPLPMMKLFVSFGSLSRTQEAWVIMLPGEY